MTTQETEEQKAQKLFQQLKRDDELSTPSFARVLERAAVSGEGNSGGWLRLRLMMAPIAALLVLLAGGWFLFARRVQILVPPPPTLPTLLSENAKNGTILLAMRPNQVPIARDNKSPKVVRHKRSAPLMQTGLLISQWRSPTDFLLKAPGQRWLNEVPRLGVPRIEIKPLEFEQKNEMEEQ